MSFIDSTNVSGIPCLGGAMWNSGSRRFATSCIGWPRRSDPSRDFCVIAHHPNAQLFRAQRDLDGDLWSGTSAKRHRVRIGECRAWSGDHEEP